MGWLDSISFESVPHPSDISIFKINKIIESLLEYQGKDPYTWYVGNDDVNVVHPSRVREEPAAVDHGTAEPAEDAAVETPPEIVETVVDVIVRQQIDPEMNLHVSDTDLENIVFQLSDTEPETSKNCHENPDSQASSSSEEVMFGDIPAKRRRTDPQQSDNAEVSSNEEVDSFDSEELEQLEKMVRELSDNGEESTFKRVMYESIFGTSYDK